MFSIASFIESNALSNLSEYFCSMFCNLVCIFSGSKFLDEMESKIQILMNNPEVSEEDEKSAQGKKQKSKSENAPVLGLFDESSEITGTRA